MADGKQYPSSVDPESQVRRIVFVLRDGVWSDSLQSLIPPGGPLPIEVYLPESPLPQTGVANVTYFNHWPEENHLNQGDLLVWMGAGNKKQLGKYLDREPALIFLPRGPGQGRNFVQLRRTLERVANPHPEPLEQLAGTDTPGSTVANKQGLSFRLRTTTIISFSVLLLLLAGFLVITFVPFGESDGLPGLIKANLDPMFGWYMLAGFAAQMIDGALGMAYGVSITTFLMSLGVPAITPAVASASMHASEIFTTGSSALVYLRYRNVNRKLFRALLIPGILGAVAGATIISLAGKEHFDWIRPMVGCYTGILGIVIILKAINLRRHKGPRVKQVGVIAAVGGFLDSVGGGGWGPIVTTSLIAGGRDLRYSIGSSHLAKFFVATVSTITFFAVLGLGHWQIIFGLVAGGMAAAPISIYVSNKIPVRAGLILVGSLVLLVSLRIILKTFIPSIP